MFAIPKKSESNPLYGLEACFCVLAISRALVTRVVCVDRSNIALCREEIKYCAHFIESVYL